MFIPGMAYCNGIYTSKNMRRAKSIRHGVQLIYYVTSSRHQARIWRLASVGGYFSNSAFKGNFIIYLHVCTQNKYISK